MYLQRGCLIENYGVHPQNYSLLFPIFAQEVFAAAVMWRPWSSFGARASEILKIAYLSASLGGDYPLAISHARVFHLLAQKISCGLLICS